MARQAGVSVATVSRVLNESTSVSDSTKEAVMRAVSNMSYKRNFLGRNLRLQETKMILVILNSITNNFYAKVVKGIEEEGMMHGYNVMLCATHGDRTIEEKYIQMLKNRMADGIIFMSSTLSPGDLGALGVEYALVQCSEYYQEAGIGYVTIDNERAAYDAVSHLINLGRKHISLISVDNQNISTKLRLNGYKRALAEAGFEYDEELVCYGTYGYKSAYLAMERQFACGKRPDAVFAISDRMAAGAIKFSIDNGLSVPDDVAVVGFDNTDISPVYNPSITTVSQSQGLMGSSAMRMLVDRIYKRTPVSNEVILEHELIIRGSTQKERPRVNYPAHREEIKYG